MTAPVKFFHSTDTGAPVLSGTAGALIAVLDACLVDGYNTLTLDALTRSGTTATATKSTGHTFLKHDVLRISGANESDYNGDFVITGVTGTTFTFEVSGTPATPATGTITARKAPAGWTKAFAGTNKAVYQSADPAATGLYLRVDDTPAQYPLVRGYEAMTDVDTGTGPFPTVAQASAFYWAKSDAASAAARAWTVVADSRMFYLLARWNSSFVSYEGFYFGDPIAYAAGDAFCCLVNGSPTQNAAGNGQFVRKGSSQQNQYCARSYTQVGTAILVNKVGYNNQNIYIGGGGAAYPNPPDNRIHIRGPIDVFEGDGPSGSILRAIMPGLYDPMHASPGNHGDIVTGLDGFAGRLLLTKAGESSSVFCAAFSLDDWRG